MVEFVGDVSEVDIGRSTMEYYRRIWASLRVYGISPKSVVFEHIPEILSLSEPIPTDVLMTMAKRRNLKRHRKSRFYERVDSKD